MGTQQQHKSQKGYGRKNGGGKGYGKQRLKQNLLMKKWMLTYNAEYIALLYSTYKFHRDTERERERESEGGDVRFGNALTGHSVLGAEEREKTEKSI